MFSNKKVALAALCFTLLGASTAYAQQPTNAVQQVAPSFDDQLALDVTPVPPGSGAIFVPSLSNPKNESQVIVYYQGQKIASGRTGQRLIVPPGEYDVQIATGGRELAAHSMARVVDGATVVMQPFYGGVRLVAVDEKGEPIQVDYDITQGGATLVDGTTPGGDDDSSARTYLLPPGPKTWKFSDGTEIAFDVPEGKFTSYRAVFQNNQFVGLDHNSSPIEKKSVEGKSMWRARLTLGADVSGGYATNQLVNFNGWYGMLGGFLNAEVGLDYKDHLATLKLNLDEAWIVVSGEEKGKYPSYSKTPVRDKVNVELLYAYRWYRVFGPFARATMDTNLFGGFFPEKGGCPASTHKNTSGFYKGTCTFSRAGIPLFAEEAVGLNVTAVDTPTFDLVLLGGVAARQNVYSFSKDKRHNYIIKDDKGAKLQQFPQFGPSKLNYELLYGAMAEARLGLRVNHILRLSLDGKMFVPYEQIPFVQNAYSQGQKTPKLFEKKKEFNPIYSVTGLAEISITKWASFVIRGEYSQPFNDFQPNTKGEYENLVKPTIYGGGSLRFQTSFF